MAGAQTKKKFRRTLLREWRKFRGLTQDQLAEKTGVVSSYISLLETGERGYTQETIEDLAKALDTTPSAILGRHPTEDDRIWSAWETASPAERSAIADMAASVMKLREG